MRFIRPRLRKPLLRGIALLGIAGAWVIGSHTWEPAIVIAIVAVGQTVYRYTWAGEDTDESALQGSRADERQKQVGLRARALSGSVALAAAYIDDKTAFGKYNTHCAGISQACRCKTQQRQEGYKSNLSHPMNFHSALPTSFVLRVSGKLMAPCMSMEYSQLCHSLQRRRFPLAIQRCRFRPIKTHVHPEGPFGAVSQLD